MSTEPLIALETACSRLDISPLGAEARAWRVDGVDVLWTPDARHWDAVAPILFPVCGWTRDGQARVDGKPYPLGLHGFARAQRFEIDALEADFARLVLRDNPATRAQYPFGFELAVDYRLGRRRLDVAARVRNTGDRPLPYAFGLHPGFRWPLAGGDRADYRLRFDAAERASVPEIAAGGLFSMRRRPVDLGLHGRTLRLCDQLFEREALCFLDAASAGVEIIGPKGRALRIELENFRHIVVWSRPGAPFVCVESWTGYGDPEGFDGELIDKPSMLVLAPGEAARHAAAYVLGDGD